MTEEILDIDLVQAQIRIAKGASLLDPSLNIPTAPQPRGVAIQCRVTSEMPWMGEYSCTMKHGRRTSGTRG